MTSPLHPGDVLRTFIGNEDVTAFAGRVGVNRVTMSRLLNGLNGISPHMALSLAEVLGTTPEKWLTLQMEYDLWHAKEDRREAESKRQFVTRYISSIVFQSETRPGRTVRLSRYPSTVTANKRDMKRQRPKETRFFD